MRAWHIEVAAPYLDRGGLAPLLAASMAEGIRNVAVLVERWRDGSQRFDVAGEQLLVAVADDDTVVGVGGLTWCPTVPGSLRVRRFYVDPRWRRDGVARSIAEPVIDAGLEHSALLTCNAGASDAAQPFWESLGFAPTSIAGITHTLGDRAAAT